MNRYISTAVAFLAILSCTKEAETEIVPIPGLLNISAETENTSSGIAGKKEFYWSKSDTLVVFDENNRGTNFGTMEDGVRKAKFSSFFWSDNTPKYASCSEVEPKNSSCSGGIVNVSFTAEQVISEKHRLAAGTSALAGRFDGTKVAMKNVTGFLRLSFAEEAVKTIKIESVDGEPLAGEVNVDCSKLAEGEKDFWTAVEGKTSSCITLTPGSESVSSEDGCFLPDSMFVALLPQTYAHGIRFTLFDKEGKEILRKTEGYNGGLTIPRSDVQRLESGLDDTLPAVILVRIDFYNAGNVNPFGTFPAIANQVVEGENYAYTHRYSQDGEDKTMDLEFGLSRGDAKTVDPSYGYSYAAKNASFYGNSGSKILNMNNHNVNGSGHTPFWIRIPKIKGRKIDSVELGIGNGNAKNFELRDTPKGSALYKGSSSIGSASALGSVLFNNSGKGMGLTDGPYYVALTSKNGYQFYYLEVKYVR